MASGNEASGYASPACFAHEVDPVYMGGVPNEELVSALNMILSVERAGAKAVTTLMAEFNQAEVIDLLSDVQRDHARFCGRLTRIITFLGGTPSGGQSDGQDDIRDRDGAAERMALLVSGQNWVINQLEALLPRIADDDHHAALSEMRDAHQRNVRDCGALLDWVRAYR